MSRTKLLLFAILFMLLYVVTVAPVFANDVVIGSPADANTGNCFPFGCAYSGEYQQVYTSSQFTGPVLITGLEFFNTQFDSGANGMNSGNWAISLSTTSYDWNSISPTYANNIGPSDNTQVFNGDLSQPWSFPNTLTIAFTNPFNYDPSQGNLLMDVNVTGASDSNGPIYFDTNGFNGGSFDGNSIIGRDYSGGTDGNVDNGYGLVTDFTTTNPVPEPSTLLMLGTGLLGLGPFLRRGLRIL